MIFNSPRPDVAIPDLPYHELVLRHAATRPDQVVFIEGTSGRQVTHGDVAGGARRLAAGLARRGFGKGDVFAIVLPNVPEYAIAFHGVLMRGGIVTTANPLYTADELAHQLADAGARYVVTVPMFLDKVSAAASQAGLKEVFVLGEAAGATPFADLLDATGEAPAVAIDPAQDLAVLPYSSGTSGRPKGVMLTHRNLVAVTAQVDSLRDGPLPEDTRSLAILPFFHIYGMVVLMNFPLFMGTSCVTLPRFEIESFLGAIQTHRVTHLYLVPPIVVALAKHPLVARFDLSSVRFINSGAAPLDEGVQSAVARQLGAQVAQGYGMTETSLAIATTPEGEGHGRPGASGQLLPNMQARIVDTASGALLGPHQDGEICVRGPNIMRGYLNNPDATAMTIEPDGWMHTGDIGHFDDEGYLYVVDRVKELIKYKGMQVAPSELEGVLLSNPAIADAAVVPRPDEEAGEIPKAFVVLKGAATEQEVMDFVAARVAPHKKIRAVEFVQQLPRSPTGKILRRVLVEQERARRAT
ncbi:MAG: 4-coumarate--CoA ligase family protein [Rubrivivax sp.]